MGIKPICWDPLASVNQVINIGARKAVALPTKAYKPKLSVRRFSSTKNTNRVLEADCIGPLTKPRMPPAI